MNYRYFLWWPGYLYIAITYFFTHEWGRKRSVAKTGRRWKYKDQLAPIVSIPIYLITILLMLGSQANQ